MALVGRHVSPTIPLVVHRAFEKNARDRPDSLALTCGPVALTYRELNDRANQFAHYLRSRDDVQRTLVGVCLDRSADLVIAILGILKAGAAYVPLDPSYPRGRLAAMTQQLSGMRHVVTSPATTGLVVSDAAGTQFTLLDITELGPHIDSQSTTDPRLDTGGDDLCYVVFTSGSTGTPKATAIQHKGWVNMFAWLQDTYDLDASSSGLALSSLGFDISQRGLMAPLFTGATLHLLPSRYFDVSLAYRIVDEMCVQTLHCAPSTLYLLVEHEAARGRRALAAMRYVFIGGEPLITQRIAQWANGSSNGCRVVHQYGVAECTDLASSYLLTREDLAALPHDGATHDPLPVGKPLHNTAIHILDEELQEVPSTEVGEVCISGMSVGRGYLNGSTGSVERFVTIESDGQSTRIYRTGDLGYINRHGDLMIAGRMDNQVKINGMRIDLGDVEHNLRRNGDIEDAIVVALPDGTAKLELIAFVIPRSPSLSERDLRAGLLEVLPPTAFPRRFIKVNEFPLNPNGKVDRAALLTRCATE